jgi:hypothetical protein
VELSERELDDLLDGIALNVEVTERRACRVRIH